MQAQLDGASVGASITVPKVTSISGGLTLQHGLGRTTRSARWFSTVRVTVPRPSWFRNESHEPPDEDVDVGGGEDGANVEVEDSQATKMTVNAKTKRNIIRPW